MLVRLLGPVAVLDPPGARPCSPNRAAELIAYLALHPGQGSAALDAALFPDEDIRSGRRNTAVHQARAWLGTDPAGRPWIPEASNGIYRLHEGTPVDWWAFQHLALAGPLEHTPDANLVAALQLVDGQPMAGMPADRYHWALPDQAEILAAVTDVAHELSVRLLRDGRPQHALWAATKGLVAEPAWEWLWRDALAAAMATGNQERTRELLRRCLWQLDQIGCDPEPETAELIARLAAAGVTSTSG